VLTATVKHLTTGQTDRARPKERCWARYLLPWSGMPNATC
jgi:hypothetical protein